jgi:predicted secreted hydrolase
MGLALGVPAAADTAPQQALRFPRDAGAHTTYRTEWWYLTGWVQATGDTALYGFQITFFRRRVDAAQALQSPLAARQLVFADAAITDVTQQRLWHAQQMARWSGAAPGQNAADLASASSADTGVVLADWSLTRDGDDLRATAHSGELGLDLHLRTTQPVLLQGERGLSRKGAQPQQWSYYYSQPQLAVRGTLQLAGKRVEAGSSSAWLDHEWSDELLQGDNVGWDWIGINLFNGSALTAFRLRDATGQPRWHGGSFRQDGHLRNFGPNEVEFQALRYWRSPLSQARYPVAWRVRTPSGIYQVEAAIDAQEIDSRQTTGAVYWEGLCNVLDAGAQVIGRGYLELTGYAAALRL